jgi:hypothetical protein
MSNNTNNNDNAKPLIELNYKEFYLMYGQTVNDPGITEEIRYQNIEARLLERIKESSDDT